MFSILQFKFYTASKESKLWTCFNIGSFTLFPGRAMVGRVPSSFLFFFLLRVHPSSYYSVTDWFKLRETEWRRGCGFPWQQVYVISDSVLHGTFWVFQRPISPACSGHNPCMDAMHLLLQVHILPAAPVFPAVHVPQSLPGSFRGFSSSLHNSSSPSVGPQTPDAWVGKVYFSKIFFLPMCFRTVATSSGLLIPLSCFRWQPNVLPLILVRLKLRDDLFGAPVNGLKVNSSRVGVTT